MKRRRTSGFSNGKSSSVGRAIAAAINSKYPLSTYGRTYHKRGTPENLSLWGPTYRRADSAQRANRKQYGYYGKGAYWGKTAGQVVGSRLGMLAGALGGPSGVPVGGLVGGSIGSYLGDKGSDWIESRASNYLKKNYPRYSGSGAYSKSNSLMRASGGQVPKFVTTGDDDGSILITKQEYCCDLIGGANSSYLEQKIFFVNPANEDIFPWLASLAPLYREYRIEGMVLHFKSVVPDAVVGGVNVGTVMIAESQDVQLDVAFGSKPQILSATGSVSSPITQNIEFGIECDPRKRVGKNLFVTDYKNPSALGVGSTGSTVDQDPTNYFHTSITVAVNGLTSNYYAQQLGEIWVSYKIRLMRPQLIDKVVCYLYYILLCQFE